MANEKGPDQLDLGIVRRLQATPLATNKSLAQALGVAETTVAVRIRAMADGNMMRVVVQRDFATVGYDQIALIYARVHGRPVGEAVTELCAVPQANSVTSTLGFADVFVVIGVADHAELREVVDHRIALVEGLEVVEEQVCLEIFVYSTGFGDLRADHTLPRDRSRLEPLDDDILAPLMFDARISNREVGRRLGISEGAVRQRLKRLFEARQIRLGAILDSAGFGLGVVALVRVTVAPPAMEALVERARGAFSFVARTTGRHNIVLLATGTSDADIIALCDAQLRHLHGVRAIEVLKLVANEKHNYNLAKIG